MILLRSNLIKIQNINMIKLKNDKSTFLVAIFILRKYKTIMIKLINVENRPMQYIDLLPINNFNCDT